MNSPKPFIDLANFYSATRSDMPASAASWQQRLGSTLTDPGLLMADLHIDDFYKDVARIFIQLYVSFPRKIILYVEDICGPDSPDEFGLPNPRFLSCFSTMVWLAETGYLNYATNIRQEALDQVTLSHRGFTLLYSRIPHAINCTGLNSLEDHDSVPANIDLLRHALKHGSSDTLAQLVQLLLQIPYPMNLQSG